MLRRLRHVCDHPATSPLHPGSLAEVVRALRSRVVQGLEQNLNAKAETAAHRPTPQRADLLDLAKYDESRFAQPLDQEHLEAHLDVCLNFVQVANHVYL